MEGELIATEHEDWRHFARKALANRSFLAGALITVLRRRGRASLFRLDAL
jgi:hypothetical protein